MEIGDKVREKHVSPGNTRRYGIIVGFPEVGYARVKIMTPTRGVPAGGTATLWMENLEVVSKIPVSKTGTKQKEKFEQKLIAAYARKDEVEKSFRPLFGNILRLAASSYNSGYPQRAGQELKRALKYLKG